MDVDEGNSNFKDNHNIDGSVQDTIIESVLLEHQQNIPCVKGGGNTIFEEEEESEDELLSLGALTCETLCHMVVTL